jgi:hypothetical protein
VPARKDETERRVTMALRVKPLSRAKARAIARMEKVEVSEQMRRWFADGVRAWEAEHGPAPVTDEDMGA